MLGWASKIPVSFCPMWIVPAGSAVMASVGATVASGIAVGDSLELAVGVGSTLVEDTGVAVAEEPQANSSATNSTTIALDRCLKMGSLALVCRTFPSLVLRNASKYCRIPDNRYLPNFGNRTSDLYVTAY